MSFRFSQAKHAISTSLSVHATIIVILLVVGPFRSSPAYHSFIHSFIHFVHPACRSSISQSSRGPVSAQ